MLDYLVTSRARRALLRSLWADEASGNVSELARKTGLGFATAHRELEAMRAAGLALSERHGNAVVYRKNAKSREAPLVSRLVEAPREPSSTHDDQVRGRLRAVGAPLTSPAAPHGPRLEVVLGEALRLAHRDATVARVLPLVLHSRRNELDMDVLVREATLRDERDTLGFFLDLTADLGDVPAFAQAASELHDARRTRRRPFFAGKLAPHARAAALRNTPPAAKRWGFLMNMGLDSFETMLERHAKP